MKILIVDDNQDRSATLVSNLIERSGCSRSEIEVRFDGQSARDALEAVAFDLLVLDVMLPHRFGDTPSEQTAVMLLTELSQTNRLKKPRHIIGLTAYESAEHTAAQDFSSRSWVLIRQDSLNDDWLRTIENAVTYIQSNENNSEPVDHIVDVVIITALQLEMDAIRHLPWDWQADEVLDDSQFFSRGTFRSGGVDRSVVAAVSSRMGMVSAAVLTSKLVKHFRPKLVVMPGICAGVRDKVELGDVVCSEMSWNYQSGKHVSMEKALPSFQMDPHFIQTEPLISARIDNIAKDETLAQNLWRRWNPKYPAPPRLVRGPVASGSAVIADGEITESIRLQQRKLTAIEMELYGVFYACEQAHRPKPFVLGLKGVCDFADEEKSDSAQAYAAYTSAEYVREFCERYAVDL